MEARQASIKLQEYLPEAQIKTKQKKSCFQSFQPKNFYNSAKKHLKVFTFFSF